MDKTPEQILSYLLQCPAENEVLEFKEAKNDYDFSRLGKYFSALCNEANLKRKSCAWLVFGVQDKGHKIVGSNYRRIAKDLQSLKREIADKTTYRTTFQEIYEVDTPEGRVVMFQIPAAPTGIPVAFDGAFYGREGESLAPLSMEEQDRIRNQTRTDWSAVIVPDASIDDLDPVAVKVARENFKSKFPAQATEADGWDDITFLNKAKITIKGKITRTAILLLGRDESEHYLSPVEAKIRWLLKDSHGNDKDYLIACCPLLLAVDKIFAKIRNTRYRYIKDGTLFPEEIDQYDPFTIREAINNCIAHQDYTLNGRINVVEQEDQLIFTNVGTFLPGDVETVIREDAPPEIYRNPFLVTAMFNLKMVDTAGGGIKKMFWAQRQRFFPLPDYDFSNNRVKVTVVGKVLDLDFARLLARNQNLSLTEIMALDKVQKGKTLNEEEERILRKHDLLEGRKPNFVIAASVAAELPDEHKAEYIHRRGLDDNHYKAMIIQYLEKFEVASKNAIRELLIDKLPDVLTEKQKEYKITNLLASLRREGRIKSKGLSSWTLGDAVR